jgi:SAM-dependent methyltransferase
MGGPPEFGGFSDVDATGDPGGYAGYLDAVRGVGAVAEWKERSFALLEPRPGAVLLDVGCGAGDDALVLARRVAPGGRVIGIDLSAAMIDEARRRDTAGAVDFRAGDAGRLEVPDDAVDGARAERTLQHLDRPEAAVAEMARVVRPGGRVVLAEPDWGTLVVDPSDPALGRELARSASERVRSGTVGRRLRGMLAGAGLAEVDVAARVLLVADAARARLLFDLDGALGHAVAAGRVAPATADSWRSDVHRAAAEGRHLAAMTAFMAWGRAV